MSRQSCYGYVKVEVEGCNNELSFLGFFSFCPCLEMSRKFQNSNFSDLENLKENWWHPWLSKFNFFCCLSSYCFPPLVLKCTLDILCGAFSHHPRNKAYKPISGNFVSWLWGLDWVLNTWFDRKFFEEQFSTLMFFHKNAYLARYSQKNVFWGFKPPFKKISGRILRDF